MDKKKRIVIILISALLLELFYFNADYFYKMLRRERSYNVVFSLNNLEMLNWERTPEGMCSQPDPILFRQGINMDVTMVEIVARADRTIPYVFVFYTNANYPEFCEQTMVLAGDKGEGKFVAQLPGQIQDIRVDLGDDPGLRLYDLTICLNPLRFRFSVARFVAMLVICFGFWGLTRLQSSPEYILIKMEDSNLRNDGEKHG